MTKRNITAAAIVCAIVAAAGGIAGAADKLPFTVSVQTTVLTEPLKGDGTVDYVAAINERTSAGVTPENNGFVTWLRVIGTNEIPASERDQLLVMCGAEDVEAETGWKNYADDAIVDHSPPLRLWTANEYPEYAKYLKDQDKLLTIAEEAAARPMWWCPNISSSGMFVMVLLPDLNSLRNVSWVLCERALLRAKQGDFEGFLADVTAVKRLSRHAVGWTAVSHLEATAIERMADETIGDAVGAGLFSSEQCAKLAKMLDGLEPLSPFWQAMDVGERWFELDMDALIALGKVDPAIGMTFFKTVDRDSVDWNAVLKRTNELVDDEVAAMKIVSTVDADAAKKNFQIKMKPILAHRVKSGSLAMRPGETKAEYTQGVGDAIFAEFVPSFDRADNSHRATIIRENLVRILVAAGEYRGDKGKWPQKLADLVPQYLQDVVKDPYSADGQQPVRYVNTGAGVLVYSIGPNRVDDGGVWAQGKDDIAIGAAR